eukprot:scaffold683_cov124-Cylindrotheca_fusiformis.AAC.34
MNKDRVPGRSEVSDSMPTTILGEHVKQNHCSNLSSRLSENVSSISFEDYEHSPLPASPPSLIGSNPNTPSPSSSPTPSSIHGVKSVFSSKSLRSNLTREQLDRDPLFFYEVIKTLGAGSMGSVARVKKRTNVVGGSARKEIQEAVKRQKRHRKCLKIPIIGNLFRFCIDGDLKHQNENGLFFKTSTRFSSILKQNGSVLAKMESFDSYRESFHGSDVSDSSRKNSGIHYAMKSIHLNRVTDSSFVYELRNEIAILKQLDHPHIVRAIETFEHRNQIFIVMELCSGGDLYSRDPYNEEDAARILSSVLSALSYMHSKNVVHRDLKYENILFVNESAKAEVKLIDFGLSKVYGDNAQLTEGVGTIYTMAPEVLKGNYTTKADVWSVGVIAYMLLSSQMPFYGRKRHHVVEQILNCQFDFRGRRWRKISEQAKAFIEDLLVSDPDDRLDAQNAMSSSWLNRRFAATTREPLQEEENMARSAMLRYAGYTKLKKMALMVVAHRSSGEEIGILRKIFQKYDSKRDGSISFDEFCCALEEFGHSDDDLKAMFQGVDLDGTGRIRYTEFLAATIEARGAISEERLAEAFDRLDSDDSGYISAENLGEILGQDFPADEINSIIREADITKDGRISYAEFLSLWETKNEKTRDSHLKLLGNPTHLNEFDLLSGHGSRASLDGSSSSLDGLDGRASFVLGKHSPRPVQVYFDSNVLPMQPRKLTSDLSNSDYIP